MILRRRLSKWEKLEKESNASPDRPGRIGIVVVQHVLLWSSCYAIASTIYLATVVVVDAMVLPALALTIIAVSCPTRH